MTYQQDQIVRILKNDPGNYYCQASSQDQQQFKEFVHGVLTEGVVTVEFIKADGQQRTMNCTLSETLGAVRVNKDTQRTPNPDICVVWDCDQDAWRSFRWDRLQRIEFTLE